MAAFVSGASRGVGLALVDRLLRRTSVNVIATGRTALESPGLQALQGKYGSRLMPVNMDVAKESSIKEAVAATASIAPKVNLLIHSAALMHPSGRGENGLSRLSEAAFTEVLLTNVVGPALLTKELYARLKTPKGEAPSKVVAVGAGVGSVSGNKAGGWYSYRTSKTALNALMKNISIEGARSNVMAVTLYPEMVDTVFAKPYLKGNPYPQLRTPEEVAEKMLDLIDSYDMADTGRFVNLWSEEDIPW